MPDLTSRKSLAMLLILGAVQAHAYRDSDLGYSTVAGLGATSSIALAACGGADQFGPIVTLLGVASLIGGVVTTSDVSKNGMGHWHKLMVQLKTDHDTYLVGGEMTPFLQGLYRELKIQKSALAPEGTIDEERLTEAIDRVLAVTEARVP